MISKNMKIVVLDKKYFLSDFPANEWGAEWVEYDDTSVEDIVQRLQDADIALTNGVSFNRDTIMKLPKLKMISVNSTGYERIDIEACREIGITVCNVNDWCTNAVVEHILALIFSLNRLLPSYDQFVKNGNWKGTSHEAVLTPPKEIRGSVLGIIGYGTIGKHLSDVCSNLGLNVLIAEHKYSKNIRQGYTAFDDVIKYSDFIILQAPLNKQTYHLISYPELELMSPSAFLINCGRGGLINEKALLDALEHKRIAGAALDVLEVETFEDAKFDSYRENNLIITPHIAFHSKQSIAENTEKIINNIRQFINGTPINKVN